ncbi:MAG: HAD family hydrolase [Cyanobacteria bacterium CRU_2_1]|nr:HAD family hydrolase [Cyanobacteria bacterium CRU_2_1]
MTKVLVFDLDDTLFPEHQFVFSGFQAVSDWMLEQYSVSGFFEIIWRLFKHGKRRTIFNQALEYLQIPYKPSLIQELVQIYRDHTPMIALYEDAQWALDYFKTNKQLGLITNGYLTTQQNKVEALGIVSRFNAIVYCGAFSYKYWKPSPVPYLQMMELTGCEGTEYIYVGDHPYKDFIAAKNLGWITVRICRADGEHVNMTVEEHYDANIKITSLYELKNIC